MFEFNKLTRQRKVVSYAMMLDLIAESLSSISDIDQNIKKHKAESAIAIHDAFTAAVKEKKHVK